MRLGFAAMLSSLTLVACSLGSPSTEPEPEPKEAATSSCRPDSYLQSCTRTLSPLGRRREARQRAASYKGKKCLHERPTLVGTPGDDRIRATSSNDVIITLGGNDVIVGPNGAEWMDSYCTGTGDDQVFYYEGKVTTGLSGSIEFSIDLGPGDDRVTVFSRPSEGTGSKPGPGTTRSSSGLRAGPALLPAPATT